MQTFYFNTGVKIWDNPHIRGGIDSGNGTVVIPVIVEDVPKGAIFAFACNTPDMPGGLTVREIKEPNYLFSKYAYFQTNKITYNE